MIWMVVIATTSATANIIRIPNMLQGDIVFTHLFGTPLKIHAQGAGFTRENLQNRAVLRRGNRVA